MSDLWLVEYESALEDFDAGKVGKLTTVKRLKKLGMDADEIRQTMEAYNEAKRRIERWLAPDPRHG